MVKAAAVLNAYVFQASRSLSSLALASITKIHLYAEDIMGIYSQGNGSNPQKTFNAEVQKDGEDILSFKPGVCKI